MNKLLSLLIVFSGFSALAVEVGVKETWGGQGIQVRVFSDLSAAVTFDCASGGVGEGEWLVKNGKLDTIGYIRIESGVRRPPNFRVPLYQATFAANVNLKKGLMTLTVDAQNRPSNTYHLKLNAKPVLRRCM
jgi:hypothetical protein